MLLSKSNISNALMDITEPKRQMLLDIFCLMPPPIDSPGFGLWVKTARERLNMSQSEIAQFLDVGRDRISKLEARKTSLNEETAKNLRSYLIDKLKQSNLI